MYVSEMIPTWTLTVSILAALLREVSMLRMVDLRIPSHTIRGQPVRLECHYDLEGQPLYSVKWYKDGNEFYRFLPGDDPPAQIFNIPGVIVDLSHSSDNTVTLREVNLQGTGDYRCEVSGEAPSFQTDFKKAQMIVVDLPDSEGPDIRGEKKRYHTGDIVRVNCTSSRSRPAASLAWFINQEPVPDYMMRTYPILVDEEGYETSTLGLHFKVQSHHFKEGTLKIKCVAMIAKIYYRTNEISALGQGDYMHPPPLESRGPGVKPGKREASIDSGSSWLRSNSYYDKCSIVFLVISSSLLSLFVTSLISHRDLR